MPRYTDETIRALTGAQLTAKVSGLQVTISRGADDLLGIDFENGTVGHRPDGETWHELAAIPRTASLRIDT